MPASLAASNLGVQVVASCASEIGTDALIVCVAEHPDAAQLGDLRQLSRDTISSIVASHPGAAFLLTGGVPCQQVSKLSAERRGPCEDGTARRFLARLVTFG